MRKYRLRACYKDDLEKNHKEISNAAYIFFQLCSTLIIASSLYIARVCLCTHVNNVT